MNVYPAVGIVAVLAGASLVGAVGALLALPVIATIQAFAGAYVRRHGVVPHPHPPGKEVTPSVPRRKARRSMSNPE